MMWTIKVTHSGWFICNVTDVEASTALDAINIVEAIYAQHTDCIWTYEFEARRQ